MDKNELIKNEYSRIVSMANKLKSVYDLRDDMTEDIISEGCISLIEQADCFDDTLVVPFWSYAKKGVYGAMIGSIQKMITTFDITEHLNRQFTQISRITAEFPHLEGTQLSEIVSEKLNVSKKKASELLSLYSRIRIGNDEETFITDKNASPDELLFLSSDDAIIKRICGILETSIPPRQAEYVRLRYGVGCERLSCTEIAEEFCVTESAIRKGIKAAIKKIKEEL